MAVTIFGFCLHAVMRQTFPSLQPYPGHKLHHGHLNMHYTFTSVVYATLNVKDVDFL